MSAAPKNKTTVTLHILSFQELSKIPMPVNFSEPISVLQRVTEDLEYANLLETGAKLVGKRVFLNT